MVVLILFLLVESQFDVFWSFLLGRIAMLKVDTLGRGARGPVVSIRRSDGAGACPLRCHQMWPGKSHVKHGEKTWENMGESSMEISFENHRTLVDFPAISLPTNPEWAGAILV